MPRACAWVSTVSTLFGLGNIKIYFENGTNPKIVKKSFEYQPEFKNPNEAKIANDYFLNPENSWISAIIISTTNIFHLLNCSENIFNYINWNSDKKNEYVLIHNPKADIPFDEDLKVATIIRCIDNRIEISGQNIYPDI